MSIPAENLPRHIAVILDGNGRWAKERNLPRLEGHKAGGRALENLLETLLELQIPYVSLYVFSTENWKRPLSEIKNLFKLLATFLRENLKVMIENNMRLKVSGDIDGLPRPTKQLIRQSLQKTSENTGLLVNFCINYGSRDELASAFESLMKERIETYGADRERLAEKPQEKDLQRHLYTSDLPDVDLLIRTAGEQRLSNFLLFQCAYAELFFTKTLWPDFDQQVLAEALEAYAGRTRKFGAVV